DPRPGTALPVCADGVGQRERQAQEQQVQSGDDRQHQRQVRRLQVALLPHLRVERGDDERGQRQAAPRHAQGRNQQQRHRDDERREQRQRIAAERVRAQAAEESRDRREGRDHDTDLVDRRDFSLSPARRRERQGQREQQWQRQVAQQRRLAGHDEEPGLYQPRDQQRAQR